MLCTMCAEQRCNAVGKFNFALVLQFTIHQHLNKYMDTLCLLNAKHVLCINGQL